MKGKLAWLTTRRLLIAVLFLAILAMAARVQVDTDTWWHLASGRWMVEHGQVLKHDPFSHTVLGQPRVQHGWLVQIALYSLYAALGQLGLALGIAVIVTLTFAFVFPLGGGSPYLRAFTTLLAAITSAVVWVARPQIVSLLLTAIFIFLLDRYKRFGRAPLWFLPLLTLLWANCHGGFVTAFILMGAYLAGEGLKRLIGWRAEGEGALSGQQLRAFLLVALVCLTVVVVNPQTTRLYAYPFQTLSIGVLRDFIQEWRSPDFHQLHLQPFIWMLLLTLAAIGFSGERADLTDVGLVAGFAYLSLLAARNVALFALIDGPVLARYGAPALDRLFEAARARWSRPHADAATPPPGSSPTGAGTSPSPRLVTLNWALLGLVAVAATAKVATSLRPEAWEKATAASLPVEAVRYIQRERPPGPMFNSYNWGGYLIWTLYPDYPVFVDGRTDLYDDPFLQDYLDVVLVRENWREVLARYGVRLVLVERESVLARFLTQDDTWMQRYADDLAVIFVRQGDG
jgi:hypothetical protein